MDTANLAKVAAGKKKADMVLKNCTIINVFSHRIEHGDIAITEGIIAGIGEYSGKKEIDFKGNFVCPGFIDAHVHIESSMLTPPQFAKSVIPKGTTTVIADPHEIANVCGIKGIEFMLDSSEKLPLDVFLMLPSCVPATDYENSGAVLGADDLAPLMDRNRVLGLGEMMNYPGVINGASGDHDKLKMAEGRPVDGHAPGIKGKELNAYAASGIRTDHECTTVREMEEKISRGMYVLIREGSATRNLDTLINGVTKENMRRVMFCTDDKHSKDIKNEGHINYNVRSAVAHGIDPIDAITMASLNTAMCYGLDDRGAVAPGYIADLLVLDNLKDMNVTQVYKRGVLVASNDEARFGAKAVADRRVLDTVVLNDRMELDLSLRLRSDIVKVIQIIEDNIITKKVIRKIDVRDGIYMNNPKLDILKLAVIERHKKTGNIGIGLVEGYGLKNGAIGLTIAHDSHNIIVIGDNDLDMKAAVKELKTNEGGIAICSGGRVLASLALEVAGLMTDSPIEAVEDKIDEMTGIAEKLGVNKGLDPFITLSFLSLPVIPELKLTDRGLFDVTSFGFVGTEE